MIDFRMTVSAAQERRLKEIVSALRAPSEARMNPESCFNSVAFESEFRSKLLTQHSFIGSPLFQESFESAFLAACRQIRQQVEREPDGQRFWDIIVDGKRISLKPSKAKSLR